MMKYRMAWYRLEDLGTYGSEALLVRGDSLGSLLLRKGLVFWMPLSSFEIPVGGRRWSLSFHFHMHAISDLKSADFVSMPTM